MPSKAALTAAFICLLLFAAAHMIVLDFIISPGTFIGKILVAIIGAVTGLYSFMLLFRGRK